MNKLSNSPQWLFVNPPRPRKATNFDILNVNAAQGNITETLTSIQCAYM